MSEKLGKTFQLKNSPIQEAVITFDCSSRTGLLTDEFAKRLSKDLSGDYPIMERLLVSEQSSPKSEEGEKGRAGWESVFAVRFKDADSASQLVQYRENGFSFNRLEPYVSFSSYSDAIAASWSCYLKHAKPTYLERISMRYINRIELPFDDSETSLSDYFTVVSSENAPAGLKLNGYFQALHLCDSIPDISAQLTISTQNVVDRKLVVIVDNEVSWKAEVKPADFQEY